MTLTETRDEIRDKRDEIRERERELKEGRSLTFALDRKCKWVLSVGGAKVFTF